jgi:hypothetical protein
LVIENKTDLRKSIFYTLIIIFYLLTPVCIMAALGTMVSKKYEIDESYWRVEANPHLTSEQRRQQTNTLYKEGKRMEYKAYAFAFIAFATFVTATGLLIKRHKLIDRQKSST